MQIEGKCGPGRPKMTWKTLTERDRHEWNLNEVDPCDRDVWRSSVRSAMHAGLLSTVSDSKLSTMIGCQQAAIHNCALF